MMESLSGPACPDDSIFVHSPHAYVFSCGPRLPVHHVCFGSEFPKITEGDVDAKKTRLSVVAKGAAGNNHLATAIRGRGMKMKYDDASWHLEGDFPEDLP